MFKEEKTQYCPMCEEWAEKYDQLKASKESLSEIADRLQNQNHELTKENEKLKEEKIELENNFAVEIQARLYHTHEHLKYAELSEKLKQALEEIREIQKDCEGCKGDCCYCYSGSGWIFKLSDEVLKGNFEVLDE